MHFIVAKLKFIQLYDNSFRIDLYNNIQVVAYIQTKALSARFFDQLISDHIVTHILFTFI